MLSFITDLFPAVYAEEEKHEEVAAEEAEEEVAPVEEEEEEPEDIKPEIEEGKYSFGSLFIFFFSSLLSCRCRWWQEKERKVLAIECRATFTSTFSQDILVVPFLRPLRRFGLIQRILNADG